MLVIVSLKFYFTNKYSHNVGKIDFFHRNIYKNIMKLLKNVDSLLIINIF